jgi:RND family efflux transporter MFP subunit
MGGDTAMKPMANLTSAPRVLAAAILCLSGCAGKDSEAEQKQAPKVSVSYPIEREVTDFAEYTGRTASPDSVQIRARVSGYLEKIAFTEGLEVREDAVLYEIDRRPYKAALDLAKAQVELQSAQLRYQEALYARSLALFEKNAQATQQMQQDLAARDTAKANLAAAKANIETANLNYGWTLVKAPISGRIGRTIVTRGNLIVADQTLLTTLVSQDPMWAYFDVDEPTVLQVQELIRQGKLTSARSTRIPVFLRLDNEQGWPHEGHVDFVNNQFDPSTATLKIRGVFKNPKPPQSDVRVLSPGQFVRIRIAISPRYDGLLVNASAVGTDQHLNYVYVVDDQNKIARHDVELGTQQGGLQVIRKGLQAGEKVVIKELQRVHQGMTVNPHLVAMPVPQGKQGETVEMRAKGNKKSATAR